MKLLSVREHEAPEFPRHSPAFSSHSKPWHPNKSLDHRQHVEHQPAGLFPPPSPISSPSSTPSNYLSKKRILDDSSPSFKQVKSYPKHDAYQYPTEDPDEKWTTYLSRKKRKHKLFLIFVVLSSCVNVVPN